MILLFFKVQCKEEYEEQKARDHFFKVAGGDGAGHIAKELVKKGVTELDFVYDEGTPILENIFPGIDKPIAG